jgi:hypothetical protein
VIDTKDDARPVQQSSIETDGVDQDGWARWDSLAEFTEWRPGYFDTFYQNQKRKESFSRLERVKASIDRRFWEKVEKTDGCWLWRASCFPTGYGHFRLGDRSVYAHRHAYVLLIGPIPEGLEIDHLCRVRACVNPAHLEPVTHRENILRSPIHPHALNAAKTHCKHGHPFDDANGYLETSGGRNHRRCRQCSRIRHRAKLDAMKQGVAD